MSEVGLLVRFDGCPDRTSAEALRGIALFVEAGERRTLGQDEFWPDELVGLEVRDPSGHRRGTVTAFMEGAAQDRLIVETPDGPVEIPFVKALVPVVDVEEGFIVVEPVEGLIPPSG